MKKIYKHTDVPLTKIRHTGLDPVSSELLKKRGFRISKKHSPE